MKHAALADGLGFAAWGESAEELFMAAAAGLTAAVFGDELPACSETRSLEVRGADAEDLLANWLSELLLWGFACANVEITRMDANFLAATLHGAAGAPSRRVVLESLTFGAAEGGGWLAEVRLIG